MLENHLGGVASPPLCHLYKARYTGSYTRLTGIKPGIPCLTVAMNSQTNLEQQSALRTLVERVRQQRLSRVWTQREMARRIGMSRTAYQDFEAGLGNVTLVNLARILAAFNLSDRLADLVPAPASPVTLSELLKTPRVRARKKAAK